MIYNRLQISRKVNGINITVNIDTKLHDIFPIPDWFFMFHSQYRFPKNKLTPIQDMIYEILPSARTLECIYESIHGDKPIFNKESSLGDFFKEAYDDKESKIRLLKTFRKAYIRRRVRKFLDL